MTTLQYATLCYVTLQCVSGIAAVETAQHRAIISLIKNTLIANILVLKLEPVK